MLFGLFSTLFGATQTTYEMSERDKWNIEHRKNPDAFNTYIDFDGIRRNADTNQKTWVQPNANGDMIKRDALGTINLSEMQRKEDSNFFREQAIKEGKTVYRSPDGNSHHGDFAYKVWGLRYIDVESGKEVVKRLKRVSNQYVDYDDDLGIIMLKHSSRGNGKFHNTFMPVCYIDAKTGYFVRMADELLQHPDIDIRCIEYLEYECKKQYNEHPNSRVEYEPCNNINTIEVVPWKELQ